MKLFKKKEVELEDTPTPYHSKKIVKEWDAEQAKYVYSLYSYTIMFIGMYTGVSIGWERIASGNKAWAERNAAHYNVEIEV